MQERAYSYKGKNVYRLHYIICIILHSVLTIYIEMYPEKDFLLMFRLILFYSFYNVFRYLWRTFGIMDSLVDI